MTLETFLDFLRQQGAPERILYLVSKHRDVVLPYLPQIEARLREKGMLGASQGEFTPEELAVLPDLKRLDEALSTGGHAAALQVWRDLLADPAARERLRAVAL